MLNVSLIHIRNSIVVVLYDMIPMVSYCIDPPESLYLSGMQRTIFEFWGGFVELQGGFFEFWDGFVELQGGFFEF